MRFKSIDSIDMCDLGSKKIVCLLIADLLDIYVFIKCTCVPSQSVV